VQQLKALLEDNAPYQARVSFAPDSHATGWNAPSTHHGLSRPPRRLARLLWRALRLHWPGWHHSAHEHAVHRFPESADDGLRRARPKSNAHGPNEFLHVPYAKKLTAAVAQVIAQVP